MEPGSKVFVADMFGDNDGENLPSLRIRGNLFPVSSKVPTSVSSTAFMESQLPTSLGSLQPIASVGSPCVPLQADQNIKTEVSALGQEYVEYGDWDLEVKDNLLLKGFQRNIEAMVKTESTKETLNISWVDDDVVSPMEDSLILRCQQFLKDEAKVEEIDKKCDLVEQGPRGRPIFGRRSRCKSTRQRRREEVGRICLRRTQGGGFEIKKEVEEEDVRRQLFFGVDNCDICPECQVRSSVQPGKTLS